MRSTFSILAAFFVIVTPVAANIGVSAWSGIACSGVELGDIEVADNFNGLTAAEETPNGACIHFDTAIPDNCDVYLCADAACNNQGTTVAGPQNAGDRMAVNFSAIQIGCQ
jgi:hypothetical protein